MIWPNFFIVGAAKAGTTSVYYYLKQHPQVFVSAVKEPFFFVHNGTRTADISTSMPRRTPHLAEHEYTALFVDAAGRQAIGEASTGYLYHPAVAANIRSRLPESRIVVILRNPIERSYSHYLMRLRTKTDVRTFADAVRDQMAREDHIRWRDGPYVHAGLYAEQLSQYFERFPRQQIAIYLYDDLVDDAAGLMRQLHAFLDVSAFDTDVAARYNVSGQPKATILGPVMRRTSLSIWVRSHLPPGIRERAMRLYAGLQEKSVTKPKMPPATRETLQQYFRDDIQQVEDLIGQDLSHWQ